MDNEIWDEIIRTNYIVAAITVLIGMSQGACLAGIVAASIVALYGVAGGLFDYCHNHATA